MPLSTTRSTTRPARSATAARLTTLVSVFVTLIGTNHSGAQPPERVNKPTSGSSVLPHAERLRPTDAPAPSAVDPVLRRLLTDWSRNSDRIQTLTGKQIRCVYDVPFGTVRLSQGKFGYERPDKGRMTLTPTRITPQTATARGMRRQANGRPFDPKPDSPQRWICNGKYVFDIDEAEREARVVDVPPEQQGANIMNTPLPFLFGMPPDTAMRRFDMRLSGDLRPKKPYVLLKIRPRTRVDSQSWSEAEVVLHTTSWLPTRVTLTDPAKTKITVFHFSEMTTRENLIARLFGGNPWQPNLRGYRIQKLGTQTASVKSRPQR